VQPDEISADEMRVLVTGAAGFLGTHLCGALTAAGYEVRALDIASVDGDGTYELIQGDVRDRATMTRAVAGCEVVIDNAALVPVTRSTSEEYRSVNVDGCRTTLQAARDADAYVVHISSSAIYGVPAELPVTSETPLAPFEPYGASKAEAERVLARERARGLRASSLRPRTLLGAGRLGLFDVIFARVRAGKRVPLFGRGDNHVQMCDVDDFCAAALAAIERRADGDYNVGAAQFGTARQDIEALIEHAGTGAGVLPVPVWAIRAVLQPLALVGRSPFTRWHWVSAPAPFYFDIAETTAKLGWRPLRSNAQALSHAYDRYVADAQSDGTSAHRRPLQGALARMLRG
jgi:nucleoside-diphosphate-sugar epimerase